MSKWCGYHQTDDHSEGSAVCRGEDVSKSAFYASKEALRQTREKDFLEAEYLRKETQYLREVLAAAETLLRYKSGLYNYASIEQRDAIREATKIWEEYWK